MSSDADEVTVSGAVAGTKYLLVTAYTSNATDVTHATLYGFDLTSYATYLTNSNAENAAANLGTYATFTATDTDNRALSDFNYLQYSVYSGGSNSGNPTGQMDDFRLGTQITDVVNVVPESGSALLGSLGVLALLRRRRQIQPHLVNPHFPALRPGLDRRSVAETPPMALSGASRRKQIPSSLIFQSKKTTKQHMKNRSILTLVSFVSGLALPMHAATIVDNATSIAAPLTSTTNISAITDSFQNTDDKFFRRNSAASVGTLTYQPVSEEITNVTVRLYLHDSIYNDVGFNTAKFDGTILGFTNGANNSSITVGSFNDANIATNSGWRIYDVTSSGIFSTPTLIVTLGNPFNSSDTWRSNIDTVTLTTVAVPEPSGFALLLGSVGAISLLRRRR